METTEVSIQQLEAAIRRLPANWRRDVLLFVEFLEYTLQQQENDQAEHPHLWAAVEAHQRYRSNHPEEEPEIFDTADAFLRATDDI